MNALKVVWEWFKRYWLFLLTLVAVIVYVSLTVAHRLSCADTIKRLTEEHALEVKRINDVRDREVKEHKENFDRLNAALAAAQTRYESAKKELADKKKAEIEDIIRKYKNDPEGLARQLFEVTGFEIIMPE